MSYKEGQYVIVHFAERNTNELGIIANIHRFRKTPRRYDVRLESGKMRTHLPVDDSSAPMYIDSNLDEVASKMKTALTLNTEANIPKNLIREES